MLTIFHTRTAIGKTYQGEIFSAGKAMKSAPIGNLKLGHANLGVTSKYLDRIAPQERLEAVKGREWRV